MLAACLSMLLLSLFPAAAVEDPQATLDEPVEIRALVVRPSDLDVLADAASIGVVMQRLGEIGFNAVVPMAWERGRTLTQSAALGALGLGDTNAFGGRDVLQEIVFEAHRAGLEVLVGLDGTLAVDPATKFGDEVHLTDAKDRLDPRDAGVRTAARTFALEIARAAEIDGFVLCNGLTAFTREEARDPAATAGVTSAHAELAAWREELRAFDPGLVVGWAANDARFALPDDGNGLDFMVISASAKDVPAGLAKWIAENPGRVALWRDVAESTKPEAFGEQLAAARKKPYGGEVLASFSALVANAGALADVLNQGFDAPYYARATLPWRNRVTWRPATPLIPLFNDSGTFEKVDADIPYARLEAGLPGSASWPMKPTETGTHELWVYLPPASEPLPALSFTIPTDERRVLRVVHPAGLPHGWTRIARAHIATTQKQDVLRLEVEPGGTRAIEIGALVALPRRRVDSR